MRDLTIYIGASHDQYVRYIYTQTEKDLDFFFFKTEKEKDLVLACFSPVPR